MSKVGRKNFSEEIEWFHKWFFDASGTVLLTEGQKAKFENWLLVDEIIKNHGHGNSAAKMVEFQLQVSNVEACRLIQQTIAAFGVSTKNTRQYFRNFLIEEGMKAMQIATQKDDMASWAKIHANMIKLTGSNIEQDDTADESKFTPSTIVFMPVQEVIDNGNFSPTTLTKIEQAMDSFRLERQNEADNE